ncbi:tail protein X [Pannonibacter sp. SL95]|uniref:tail protein X n=1 Tax=Pannonibacter sp. SL95 TaxID=2995153 RepID=UPI002276DF65|nr:tail protein X [Pannonibacter sp. SL95]MCY1704451.1 tail protein X [Pannonibacter sp. SL95]MCY1706415.1 tail protein X [Pannonibacter sp. SL95]
MATAVKTGEFLEHRTGSGERWDTIATRYYRDPEGMGLIIDANKGVFLEGLTPLPTVLPAGVVLRIPVIEQAAVDETLLPPWKRRQS